MATPRLSRRGVEALIVRCSWSHPTFRAEFPADPKATIETHSGEKLPASLNVTGSLEDDRTIHFAIPANTDELSKEDMEKVAGRIDLIVGLTFAFFGGVIATAGAASHTQLNKGW